MQKAKLLQNWCIKTFGIFCGAFALALVWNMQTRAQDVTVQGNDIQAALSVAENAQEHVTVTIPQGEYTVDAPLVVFSNTTVNATGAVIHTGASGRVLLNIDGRQNVTVNGGTWVGNSYAAIEVLNAAGNVVLDGVTVQMADGAFRESLQINGGSGAEVRNCAFQDATVLITNTSGVKFTGNRITGAKSLSPDPSDNSGTGLLITNVSNCEITGNTISDSDYVGLHIRNDSGSLLQENTVTNSISRNAESGKHGEGFIVWTCTGTKVMSNYISNTKSWQANNGNGIMVCESSKDVTVENNRVTQSGNHGIQVTANSTGILLKGNTISGTGNMGVSVSRGSAANLDGNVIGGAARHGVTFDGREGAVKGEIRNCTISGNGVHGIHIMNSATAIIVNNVLQNNNANKEASAAEPNGLAVDQGSTVSATGNRIYQDELYPEGIGIIVSNKSTAQLESNIIGNYGRIGVYAFNSSLATGSNNVVDVKADSMANNAYYFQNASTQDTISENTLVNVSVSATTASGQNYLPGVEAGAVSNGQRYKTQTAAQGGTFTVSYPSTDASAVIVYVVDGHGNAVCFNAPPTFNLHDVTGSTEAGGSGQGQAGGTGQSGSGNADIAAIQAFVNRLYNIVLSRVSDPAGLEDWTNQLAAKTSTGAVVAHGFFDSKELKEKNLSDAEYVNILYRTVLDRDGDPAGMADWQNKLQYGLSRMYVFRGFIESPEFKAMCAGYGIEAGDATQYLVDPRDQNENVTMFVARNYVKALGRSYEEAGLNNWCANILAGARSPEAAVKEFILGEEFTNHHYSNEQTVRILYATYFDREADPAGLADWLGRMENGWTLENVIDGFAGSQEFHELLESFHLS